MELVQQTDATTPGNAPVSNNTQTDVDAISVDGSFYGPSGTWLETTVEVDGVVTSSMSTTTGAGASGVNLPWISLLGNPGAVAAQGAVTLIAPIDAVFSDLGTLDDLLMGLGGIIPTDASAIPNGDAPQAGGRATIAQPGNVAGPLCLFIAPGLTGGYFANWPGLGGGMPILGVTGSGGITVAPPDALPIPHTAETDFGTTTAPSAAFAITIDPAAAGGDASQAGSSSGGSITTGPATPTSGGGTTGGLAGMVTNLLAQAGVGMPGARDGHHWIPQSVYEALGGAMDELAKRVFETATLDPIFYNHGADTWNKVTHPQYTATVKKLLQDFIKFTTNGSRPLTGDEAQLFLEMVRDGKNLDLPFAVTHAAELKTIIAWRNGFLDSIALAKGFTDKAAQLGVTLTKEEVKAMTQGWLGQSNKKLSANAAKVSNALREELKLLDPAARQAKFGLLRKAAALAVAYSIIQAASDAYAADGTMSAAGIAAANEWAKTVGGYYETQAILAIAVIPAYDALWNFLWRERWSVYDRARQAGIRGPLEK